MAEKKPLEETLAEMDASAQKAREEFDQMKLDGKTIEQLTSWLNKWVQTAGWKRLGRIIAGKD